MKKAIRTEDIRKTIIKLHGSQREFAKLIGVHESTISRALTDEMVEEELGKVMKKALHMRGAFWAEETPAKEEPAKEKPREKIDGINIRKLLGEFISWQAEHLDDFLIEKNIPASVFFTSMKQMSFADYEEVANGV